MSPAGGLEVMPAPAAAPALAPFANLIRPELSRAVEAAIAAVPAGRRGLATVTATRDGIEIAAGARVWRGLSVAAVAGRAWGGAWQSIGRASIVW